MSTVDETQAGDPALDDFLRRYRRSRPRRFGLFGGQYEDYMNRLSGAAGSIGSTPDLNIRAPTAVDLSGQPPLFPASTHPLDAGAADVFPAAAGAAGVTARRPMNGASAGGFTARPAATPGAISPPAPAGSDGVVLPELVVMGRRQPHHWYDPVVDAAHGALDAVRGAETAVADGWEHLLGQFHRPGRDPARPPAALQAPRQVPGGVLPHAEPPGANPHLGSITQQGESGGRGAGVVSTGRGDHGGVSYGSYQLASNMGKPQDFVRNEGKPWAGRLAGLEPGSPEYTRVWKAIAAEDPSRFSQAQQAYAQRVYFDSQAARIQKVTGIDIRQRSHALQESVFSTAIQLGENTGYIAKAMKSVQPDGGRSVSDAALVRAIYAERLRLGRDGKLVHFPQSVKLQPGIKARLVKEQQRVLDALRADPQGAVLEGG